MKTTTRYFTLIVTAMLLTSCGRNNEHTPKPQDDPNPPMILLEKVISNDQVDQFHYDTRGALLHHTSGAVSNPAGQGNEDLVSYDQSHRVEKVTRNGLHTTRFYYKGDTLNRTEEYDHRNRLAVTHSYHFAGNRLIQLLDKVHADGDGQDYHVKTTYTYWPDGNVSIALTSMTKPGGEVFFDWYQAEYDQYDQNPNPVPGIISYPYLHNSILYRNNPRKITIRNLQTAAIASVETNTLTYNDQGYPTQRIRTMLADGKEYKTTLIYSYINATKN